MHKLICIAFVIGWSHGAPGQSTPDRGKEITFEIKNFGISVEGTMGGLQGDIRFETGNPSMALFDVSVNANSVDTGISLRDNHLRKEEYLDVKNYPHIKFVSLYVEKGDEPDQWMLTGELTIKKTTRKISFPFSVLTKPGSNNFKGEFRINRRDFGVGGKSISMADELLIKLNVTTGALQ